MRPSRSRMTIGSALSRNTNVIKRNWASTCFNCETSFVKGFGPGWIGDSLMRFPAVNRLLKLSPSLGENDVRKNGGPRLRRFSYDAPAEKCISPPSPFAPANDVDERQPH